MVIIALLSGCTNINFIGDDNQVIFDPEAGIMKDKTKKVK